MSSVRTAAARWPVLLGLCCIGSAAHAQTCDERLAGHVGTVRDVGIGDVEVRVGDRAVRTAEDGRFVIGGLCAGPVQLQVVHPDYLPWRGEVTAPDEHLDLTLEDDVEVVVVESTAFSTLDPHSTTTVDGAVLERSRGQDLAEALASVPGVTVMRTSADTTRPIVRGQYGRRLLLLRDGMRHEGQKWGDEHAPEVDPFAASSISVVRGAAGVRYGPDAIGGVVLLQAPPLRTETGLGGRVDLVAVSNGARGVGGFQLDAANGRGLSLRLQGNLARGAALQTPDYVLGNTGSQTSNLGITAGLTRGDLTVELGWRRHDNEAGICYCLHSSSPDALQQAFAAERPVGSASWKADYTLDRPRQEVHHDLVYGRLAAYLGAGTLEVTVNSQFNRRREYERARESIEGPQFDFTLRTHTVDTAFVHDRLHLGSLATVQGSLGITGMLQDNVFRGLPLVPNHRAVGFGAFVAERVSLGHAVIEVGGRFDHQSRTTYLTEDAWSRHLDNGLDPDACEDQGDAASCGNAWNTGSVTVGGVWHDAGERFEARLDLSSASRFPSGDELYLYGAAPSRPVYGIGNPALGTETTWTASPSLQLALGPLTGQVGVFGSRTQDYIRFGPVLDASGAPRIDVTIRGAYPRYATTAIEAWHLGGEAQLDLELGGWVAVSASGSLVRAGEVGTGAYLPFVPPDRLLVGARLHPPGLGAAEGASLGASARAVRRQDRSDATTDLAPAPPGSLLFDVDLDVPIELDSQRFAVGVSVDNLLNHRMRSYTSLLRFFADDPGREVRLRGSFTF